MFGSDTCHSMNYSMSRKVRKTLGWLLAIATAFFSGLASSSFVIGDSNLLVSSATLASYVLLLWAAHRVSTGMSIKCKCLSFCLFAALFVLAFILSLKGVV